MELQEINELCYRIITFYNYNSQCKKTYTSELYEEIYKEFENNLLSAKEMINENIIKKINSNYSEYPDIFNYCIVFNEDLISNELLLELLSNNHMNGLLNILMMNKELDDEIIKLIQYKINLNNIGEKPFDYRYHILKRTEISNEIKNDILKTYEKEELEKIVDKIRIDLEDEFVINNIKEKEQLKKNVDIYREYIAYNVMRNYLEQKVYKKSN